MIEVCALSLVASAANADVVTGTVHTLHVSLDSGRAFVQLDGLPWFNGGGCPSYWTVNDINDQNFMKYVWPLLITAKVTNARITIVTSGCIGAWSKIVAVETEPRIAD